MISHNSWLESRFTKLLRYGNLGRTFHIGANDRRISCETCERREGFLWFGIASFLPDRCNISPPLLMSLMATALCRIRVQDETLIWKCRQRCDCVVILLSGLDKKGQEQERLQFSKIFYNKHQIFTEKQQICFLPIVIATPSGKSSPRTLWRAIAYDVKLLKFLISPTAKIT